MKSEAVIRPVRHGDAEVLAATMRAADVAEVLASDGETPLESLRRSVAMSRAAWSTEIGGELAAMCGVVDGPRRALLGLTEYDTIWLLTGRAVDRHRFAYVRVVKQFLEAILRIHPVLACMVDARHGQMLRMARTLRAEICPAVPWGASGLLFHAVIWRSQ